MILRKTPLMYKYCPECGHLKVMHDLDGCKGSFLCKCLKMYHS